MGVVQSLTNVINGSYSALNKEGFGLDAEQMNVIGDDDMVTISQTWHWYIWFKIIC